MVDTRYSAYLLAYHGNFPKIVRRLPEDGEHEELAAVLFPFSGTVPYIRRNAMDFLSISVESADGDAKINAVQAARAIRERVGDFPVSFLLYFASSDNYEPETLAAEMHASFPNCPAIGCSSSGELHDTGMVWNSVTVMVFGDRVFDTLAVVSAEYIDAGNGMVRRLFADLENQTGVPMRSLDPKQYFGFILMDGLAKSNSAILDQMSDLTRILNVGGFASDKRHFRRTVVYHNGRALTNGLVYALMCPHGKWGIVKTQSVVPTGKSMVATKIAAPSTILEFDHQPAMRVYAEAIGMAPEEIPDTLWAGDSSVDKPPLPGMFFNWPLGIQAGEEPFLWGVSTVTPGGGLKMNMPLLENMRFHLYHTADIVADTQDAVEKIRTKLDGIKAMIAINCQLREIQVVSENKSDSFASIFTGFSSVGFSSYGEVYACPISQTGVLIAIA